MRHAFAAAACVTGTLTLLGFAQSPHSRPGWPVVLRDVAAQAGLTSPSIYGAPDAKRFILETNGAGVAFLDYDNDGFLDALVLSGTRLKPGSRSVDAFASGQEPLSLIHI